MVCIVFLVCFLLLGLRGLGYLLLRLPCFSSLGIIVFVFLLLALLRIALLLFAFVFCLLVRFARRIYILLLVPFLAFLFDLNNNIRTLIQISQVKH